MRRADVSPEVAEFYEAAVRGSVCTPLRRAEGRSASAIPVDFVQADAEVKPRQLPAGWLEAIPFPCALVTAEGEIAAASNSLLELTGASGKLVGASLHSLIWPDRHGEVSEALARPRRPGNDNDDGIVVRVLSTGDTFALHLGKVLGVGRAPLRLVMLRPVPSEGLQVERKTSSEAPRKHGAGSIPAPPLDPQSPLHALSGLPLTAVIIADRRVAAVTQRASVLLGVPAESIEGCRLAEFLGDSAVYDLFPEANVEVPKWTPQALPALPIRVDGAIRACACCLIPFGRPGVGLLLLEGWGGSAIEFPNEQARQSSAGYLIAGVAHEINNPLTFLIPTLGDLRIELANRREQLRAQPVDNWLSHLDESLEGISRIAGVVQNLRAAREVAADAEPTLVNQVIANTLRLAAASVPPHISIRRDLGLVMPARGNRQRLGQVIFNLIVNAVHAIDDSKQAAGNILVRTWSDARFTWLEVRDDGPGVCDEHRPHIFEPFFTTRTSGSGLGLAVCRAMVREFGGDLTLQSTPAPGACFLIRLPCWSVDPELTAQKGPEQVSSKASVAKRRKILLVDDDPPVRRALRRMLGKHHHVDEAGTLQEALEKIERNEYDVLVTDLVMSHGGGPALIEHLKANNSALADHVVVISGMAPDATPLPYPRITKPCTEAELVCAVETVSP